MVDFLGDEEFSACFKWRYGQESLTLCFLYLCLKSPAACLAFIPMFGRNWVAFSHTCFSFRVLILGCILYDNKIPDFLGHWFNAAVVG